VETCIDAKWQNDGQYCRVVVDGSSFIIDDFNHGCYNTVSDYITDLLSITERTTEARVGVGRRTTSANCRERRRFWQDNSSN
jgi:hypothetical protein